MSRPFPLIFLFCTSCRLCWRGQILESINTAQWCEFTSANALGPDSDSWWHSVARRPR